nr:autotransporter outer membrane beta-barrel domain-containing protein [Ochrobactrum sp. LM19]
MPVSHNTRRHNTVRNSVKKLCLTTTVLTALGMPAHAACVGIAGSFTCSGSNPSTLLISTPNTDVSVVTTPGFEALGGLLVTGRGEVSYTDTNSSVMNSPSGSGLYIHNLGENTPGGTLATTTVQSNANITGFNGVEVEHQGHGNVLANIRGQIDARAVGIRLTTNSSVGVNSNIDLTTTATIKAGGFGIAVSHIGSGTTKVDASGDVFSKNVGVQVVGEHGSDDVTVNTSGRIVADNIGLNIANRGRGDLIINAVGPIEVSGIDGNGGTYVGSGINAVNESLVGPVVAQNLSIRAGDVKAKSIGIQALNNGAGDTIIVSTGTVEAYNGIVSSNTSLGTGVRVEANNVIAGHNGISTVNYGTGDTTIITTGSISGANSVGINANHIASSGSLSIDASGDVSGKDYGISASTIGDGYLTITTGGILEGGNAALFYQDNALGQVNVNLNGTTRNTSTLSTDTVIDGRSGNAVITNNGLMTGVVKLSHYEETVVNNGIWNTAGGTNEFGGGDDAIVNNGTIVAASDATIAETTVFNGLATFTNKSGGVLSMHDSATGDQTIIAGDYVGLGGTIILDTHLGADASATDKIIVTGDTSGTGQLKINNTDGAGALTVADGIQVIQVDGASDATFTLLGDYVHEGAQAVVGGAYAYKLYHNGISDPADGDWYLRSVLKDPTEPPVEPPVCTPGVDCAVEPPIDPVTPPEPPLYQAGAPVYEAYPQLLLGLNGLPTLQQRVGNRYWNNGGNRIIAEGADAIGSPYAPSQEAGSFIEQNGVWGRIEGAHNRIDPRFSTTNAGYDFNTYKIQAGLDGMLAESEAGKLIGGVSVHYARGSADIRSVYDADNGGGDIRTDGYGIGGTLTWYGESGFYVDTQAQATWYDSDLGFDGGNATLTNSNHGFGYALSVEGGKRIALDPAWSLTPQAQLVWSSVDFDDFSDVFGADVRLDRGRSLQGRLGLALDHQNSWYNANGLIDRTRLYAITNLYYEFLEGTRASVAGTSFANGNERLWGGIGLGGSYNWNSDKYSIYGEGSVNTSLAQFADSYSLKGTMGFRVKW